MQKVKNGEAIEGIKQIPSTVHDSREISESHLKPIKKPWEREMD